MTDYPESLMLPHRYPFLFIDRILSIQEEHAAGQLRALMCITGSAGAFSGRLPVVFPSMLLPEALAQAGGLLVARQQNSGGKYMSGMLAGIRRVRFRGTIFSGDRLLLTVRIIHQRSGLVFLYGDVTRQELSLCRATFSCAFLNSEKSQLQL